MITQSKILFINWYSSLWIITILNNSTDFYMAVDLLAMNTINLIDKETSQVLPSFISSYNTPIAMQPIGINVPMA